MNFHEKRSCDFQRTQICHADLTDVGISIQLTLYAIDFYTFALLDRRKTHRIYNTT